MAPRTLHISRSCGILHVPLPCFISFICLFSRESIDCAVALLFRVGLSTARLSDEQSSITSCARYQSALGNELPRDHGSHIFDSSLSTHRKAKAEQASSHHSSQSLQKTSKLLFVPPRFTVIFFQRLYHIPYIQ
ncbi:hypothetical protein CC80DRAFT_324611 [Byssothecium circinans]|uniref:Uncharacterized protein n=1 Tax=Byssothecium circinans TaxID=147558 RepID=A0A6A5UDT9_9PLEO|nr:hypothetical protein CC80DRAFT_324611 [Byssothecium circinans]